jgi:hypothetical protein
VRRAIRGLCAALLAACLAACGGGSGKPKESADEFVARFSDEFREVVT